MMLYTKYETSGPRSVGQDFYAPRKTSRRVVCPAFRPEFVSGPKLSLFEVGFRAISQK